MNKEKIKKLEQKGWKVGTAAELLGLSPEEREFIEFKLALCKFLKEKRKASRLTQNQLAKITHSSQSRVAKMEKGEDSVSLDLIVRSLFELGTTKEELAKVIV
jgi:DNA-binding XRE family transcriptional regulator